MSNDQYADPNDKHPAMIICQDSPRNAGPPLDLLVHDFVTPTDLFFMRNHGYKPTIDPETYRLSVGGLVRQPLNLSLADLRERFPRVRVTATLQCAGNRRDELLALGPIPGELIWSADALGTAEWSGVPLRAILEAAEPLVEIGHVAFGSSDLVLKEGAEFAYGGSVPLSKALANEVILAYEMNGAPLTPDHGFPLRVLVPGYIGARSVKWLSSISVQPDPSDNYFQARAYKIFPADVTPETVDWSQGLMLGELSITAAICVPSADTHVTAGAVLVQGYAMAGGDRTIERVDLSADDGQTWQQATLGRVEPWSWRLWQATLDLAPGQHTLVVRAWDSATNTQPEQIRSVWNFKGYMNNAWHRVPITATKWV
jgi:sulfite oxidase